MQSPTEVIDTTYSDQVARVRAALKDRKLPAVARETGLHYNTVAHIAAGRQLKPSVETLRKLEAYLFAQG